MQLLTLLKGRLERLPPLGERALESQFCSETVTAARRPSFLHQVTPSARRHGAAIPALPAAAEPRP